jgi:hypothetical protein
MWPTDEELKFCDRISGRRNSALLNAHAECAHAAFGPGGKGEEARRAWKSKG